jgi:hypothetical protein
MANIEDEYGRRSGIWGNEPPLDDDESYRPIPLPPTQPPVAAKPWTINQSANGIQYEFDSNRDGEITKNEMRDRFLDYNLMNRYGSKEGQSAEFFKAANTNKDGVLSKDELKSFLSRRFDYNGNGTLDGSEIAALRGGFGNRIANAASDFRAGATTGGGSARTDCWPHDLVPRTVSTRSLPASTIVGKIQASGGKIHGA